MSDDKQDTRMKVAPTLLCFALVGVVLLWGATWLGSGVPGVLASDVEAVASRLGATFLIVAGGVAFFMLLDRRFLSFLQIADAFFNRGAWEQMPPVVRAAFVLGWFLVFAAIIRSFVAVS